MKHRKILSFILSIICLMAMSTTAFAGGRNTDGTINLGADENSATQPTEEQRESSERKAAIARSLPQARSATDINLYGYKQIVGYYCGPAAALTAINHLGGSVASTTKTLNFYIANESNSNCPYPNVTHTHSKSYTSPQITLATSLGTTYNGTGIGNILTVINNRQSSYGYDGAHIDDTVNSSNKSNLGTKLNYALTNDAPPILWVEARLLENYNGANFGGHFICVTAYDSTSETVGVVDVNYYSSIPTYYDESAASIVGAIWCNSTTNTNILW